MDVAPATLEKNTIIPPIMMLIGNRLPGPHGCRKSKNREHDGRAERNLKSPPDRKIDVTWRG